MIGTGAMSDPYMHCEEELKLTRRCLEIILENNFGLAIQTKSDPDPPGHRDIRERLCTAESEHQGTDGGVQKDLQRQWHHVHPG